MRTRLRALFLAVARRLTPYVTARVGGDIFMVSTRDAGVGRTLFLSGANPEFALLDHAVRVLKDHPLRDLVVDVGANIGTTTIPALRRGYFQRAVCFEPEPENLPVLEASLALNGLTDRVTIVAAAVSDEAGRASFVRGPQDRRGRQAGAGALARPGDESIDVDVVTLDAELAAIGIAPEEVGLLWMDVQGFEGHVLAGAPRIVAARPPIVLAIRPKKLDISHGRERLVSALAGYTSLVDLRGAPGVVDSAATLPNRLERAPATDLLLW